MSEPHVIFFAISLSGNILVNSSEICAQLLNEKCADTAFNAHRISVVSVSSPVTYDHTEFCPVMIIDEVVFIVCDCVSQSTIWTDVADNFELEAVARSWDGVFTAGNSDSMLAVLEALNNDKTETQPDLKFFSCLTDFICDAYCRFSHV